MIYFVTPTYPRPEQTPELIRQAHTLMHVPRIHWIVADDKYKCSRHVLGILRRSGLPYTHIASPKPNMKKVPEWLVPRGVSNRRAALDWIRQFVTEGVIYFGDDDNTVDLELFDEIRTTKGLSMFPVGLIKEYGVSSPVVRDGKVVGFFESWTYNRKFPVDMAGFALNVKSLNPTATMPYKVGFIENEFLKESGFDIENIEPLANNCTKVLVWHTKTEKNTPRILKGNLKAMANSRYQNLGKLLQELQKMDVLKVTPRNGTEAAVKLYHRDRKSFLFLADMV
ncbi:galactosylgalactosylxylosylprotein 3-beta-glucuronosyltransferase S-like [Pectinophora gossypiella]|uniref:galactosylgalactosylxylosylprotein 3-beta-glucuronosyltransferase S-like n=1 Tax=Pectinophora gossypiella TaxID=13191 RepID=UPI00214F206E|nr:galactosylgalactosylxylosylprotein 3-beta-glucuronosyltransferase S-like [Pectinophora gossypiella]